MIKITQNINKLLSPKEAADMLKCSVGFLAQLRMGDRLKNGKKKAMSIPFCKIGRNIRYKERDILAYIDANMHFNNGEQ